MKLEASDAARFDPLLISLQPDEGSKLGAQKHMSSKEPGADSPRAWSCCAIRDF